MELIKQPETELEYWAVIEGLGGFIWSTNHALAHGRIEDSTGDVDKDIQEARKLSTKLVSEQKDKFGIIPPNETPEIRWGQEHPQPPAEKRYYWDWYEETKKKYYQSEYENLICSACPFSQGADSFIKTGNIPCSAFQGTMYRLPVTYICYFVSYGEWNQDKLYQKIIEKGGMKAYTRFKAKEAELRAQKTQSDAE